MPDPELLREARQRLRLHVERFAREGEYDGDATVFVDFFHDALSNHDIDCALRDVMYLTAEDES